MKWTNLVARRAKEVCMPFGHKKSKNPGTGFIIGAIRRRPLKLSILLFFIFQLSSATAQDAWNQEWLKQDKAAHLTASAFISAASIELAKDFNVSKHEAEIIGIATALGVGMSKEFLYDSRPSPYDMGANIIGCVAGIYLNRWLQKKTSRWVERKNLNNEEPQLAENSKKAQRQKRKSLKEKKENLADVASQATDE